MKSGQIWPLDKLAGPIHKHVLALLIFRLIFFLIILIKCILYKNLFIVFSRSFILLKLFYIVSYLIFILVDQIPK